jgi:hypothetical protein
MPPETLTPDHTYLRLRQDKYFQPFFRRYLELLKPHLKRLQISTTGIAGGLTGPKRALLPAPL